MIDRPASAMQAVVARPRTWLVAALLIAIGIVAQAAVTAPYRAAEATGAAGSASGTTVSSGASTQAPRIGFARRLLGRLQSGGGSSSLAQARPRALVTMSVLAGLLAALFGWLLRGGLALAGVKLLGGQATWSSVYAVGVWSTLPFFVRDVLQSVYTLVYKAPVQYVGLTILSAKGAWLENSPPLLQALLAHVDLFSIWHLLLLTTALFVAGKLARGKAVALAVVIWIVILAVRLLPALLGVTAPLAGLLG